VQGQLPPEIVRRIVRRSFGRLRACYEKGLAARPALQGRVATRFVIDPSGAVERVSDGGSDLPDANVVQCVQRTFETMTFPKPLGGSPVVVVYPLLFTPPPPPPPPAKKP
jgi:hypothetical protein